MTSRAATSSSVDDAATGPVVLVVGLGPWGDAVTSVVREQAIATSVQVGVDAVAAALSAGRLGDGTAPGVAVITDADPGDRALIACLAADVPVVDVHRSIASVDRARAAMRTGTLVAASGWAGSIAALAVAAGERQLDGGPAEHVEVDVLLGPGDTAGDAWWRRFAGLHRSFMVYDRGQRRLVRGLAEPKTVGFAQVRRRARRFASPEQETLVETGHAGAVVERVAFTNTSTNVWLALLVGSGAWRFLPLGWRCRILRPGPGVGAHEIRVTAVHAEGVVHAGVTDPHGLAHLTAASAAAQVARILDPARVVPAGVSHPDESDDPAADLEVVRRAGVQVALTVVRN